MSFLNNFISRVLNPSPPKFVINDEEKIKYDVITPTEATEQKLTVSSEFTVSTVYSGVQFGLNILVTNNTENDTTGNILLNNLLPRGFNLESITIDENSSHEIQGKSVVIVHNNILKPGESIPTISLILTASSAGSFTNALTVCGGGEFEDVVSYSQIVITESQLKKIKFYVRTTKNVPLQSIIRMYCSAEGGTSGYIDLDATSGINYSLAGTTFLPLGQKVTYYLVNNFNKKISACYTNNCLSGFSCNENVIVLEDDTSVYITADVTISGNPKLCSLEA
jgi:hypothetical protein